MTLSRKPLASAILLGSLPVEVARQHEAYLRYRLAARMRDCGLTLSEAAARLGVSRERARQLSIRGHSWTIRRPAATPLGFYFRHSWALDLTVNQARKLLRILKEINT